MGGGGGMDLMGMLKGLMGGGGGGGGGQGGGAGWVADGRWARVDPGSGAGPNLTAGPR
jgi:hypothetical protein